MKKRTFSKEEKLKILKEAESNGVQPTLDNHGVYTATFYSWKKKCEPMGEEGFRHGMTTGSHIFFREKSEKQISQLFQYPPELFYSVLERLHFYQKSLHTLPDNFRNFVRVFVDKKVITVQQL
jgi:hypothetical protein